ncbi:MAG TPA: hypothetical protein VMW85_00120 [Methanomassiliicoccales archaeon]|nr:hypothetical protein [Methanomassiliicoccales archaeon]
MRCNNCGMDYIMDNSSNCPKCGASLVQPGYQQPPQQYQQYPDQNQQPPQGQYQQPPQQYGGQPQQFGPPQGGYYQQQPPMPSQQRVPTVRKIDLTDSLFIISALLLVAAGFQNLDALTWWGPVQFAPVLLGFAALVVGVLAVVMVVMPAMMKALGQVMDMLVLVFGIVFILWGLAATFGDTIGMQGGLITAAGLGMLFAGMLRMGLVK